MVRDLGSNPKLAANQLVCGSRHLLPLGVYSAHRTLESGTQPIHLTGLLFGSDEVVYVKLPYMFGSDEIVYVEPSI